jgi:hypothetical protein
MMRSGQNTTELKRSFAIEDGKEPTSVAEGCCVWAVGTEGWASLQAFGSLYNYGNVRNLPKNGSSSLSLT